MRNSGLLSLKAICLAIAVFMMFTAMAPAALDAWTDTTLGDGVVWRQKTYSSLYGGKQTVNVIQIDLSKSAVTLKPIRSTSGLKKTSVLASGASATDPGGIRQFLCQ